MEANCFMSYDMLLLSDSKDHLCLHQIQDQSDTFPVSDKGYSFTWSCYCIILGNIKGFPLVFTQELGEGRAITYTATEIVKGKVKETEMLLPAGYKDATEEEFKNFMTELQEAASLLEE